MKTPSIKPRICQQGVTTLIISLIILVAVTLVTMYTAKNMVVDQKITANEYRGLQASEAATAALERGISYLESTDKGDNDSDDQADYLIGSPGNSTLAGGSYYEFYFEDNTTSGNRTRMWVRATGFSDDRSFSRTATQLVVYKPFLVKTPEAAIRAIGDITVQGNTITGNNDNATGGNVMELGGNVFFTGNPDIESLGSQYSTKDYNDGTIPPGVLNENEADLQTMTADELFQESFGQSKDDVVAGDTVHEQSDCSGLPGAEGDKQIIHITGDCKITAHDDWGSAADPIILIVDGELDFGGGGAYYALIYANSVASFGGKQLFGAAIVEETSTLGGTYDLFYDGSVLDALKNSLGNMVKLTGSWRDW